MSKKFVQSLPGQIVQLTTAQLTSGEGSPSGEVQSGRSEIVHFQNAQFGDSFTDLRSCPVFFVYNMP